MKAYFTKYRPVEGRVEKGDKYYHPDDPTNVLERKGDLTSPNLQKVKLFLCSRDIQIGDKAYSPHSDFTTVIEDAYQLNDRPSEWFKVMGEISPEALTFVKEGDEFDENEIKKSSLPICPKCGAPGGNDGFCPEEIECETDKQRIIFYIKGPCGHFH
jgi:hypothetical protein